MVAKNNNIYHVILISVCKCNEKKVEWARDEGDINIYENVIR